MAREVEQHESGCDRQRDGQRDDEHGPDTAEEQQDHHAGQPPAQQHLMLHGRERLTDIEGLIKQQFHLQISRQPFQLGQSLPNAIEHGQGVGARLLEDRHVHGAPSVHPNNVHLDRRGISRRPHILQVDRDSIHHLHRKVIHLLDERNDAIAVHVVVEVADLDIPRRHQEVFGVDRLDDLVRADPARQHLLAIEKDRDLPHRSTERRRKRNSLDRAQLRAD